MFEMKFAGSETAIILLRIKRKATVNRGNLDYGLDRNTPSNGQEVLEEKGNTGALEAGVSTFHKLYNAGGIAAAISRKLFMDNV